MPPFGSGQGTRTHSETTGSHVRPKGPLAPTVPVDPLVSAAVPQVTRLSREDQHRLSEMARDLRQRGLGEVFIRASLRSTAEVMRELDSGAAGDPIFQKEHVKRFIEQHEVRQTGRSEVGEGRGGLHPRRERKREERERLQATVSQLLREARLSRGRHEVKKTRNSLLKLDQRELRRQLGDEGDELCRQINTWLRSTASMF